MAVGSEVVELFSFEADPASLVHKTVSPDLFDKSQGEMQETNPYARLDAYLLHGCEPAYLPVVSLSGT
jgi:NH3-dependent NAD+ synthetase